MSFQFVFDNAQNMTVSSRPVVASTTSRNGVVRSVSRGAAVWRFTVALPDGANWDAYRSAIATVEAQDRFTNETVDFSNSGFAWMFPYQGDEANIANVRVNVLNNQLSIATGVTATSGNIFEAGDIIQLVGGRSYRVTAPVRWDETVIPTHRPPVDEPVGTYDIRVGNAAQFTVVCVNMPNWTFIERNQIAWEGPFIFQEVL